VPLAPSVAIFVRLACPSCGIASACRAGILVGVVEPAKHLLVDGSNVVYAWPELRQALQKEGRDVARGRLVEQLRVLHDFERLRVSVVFDGRGAEIAVERPTHHTAFSVVYSPAGMTADDVIEQLTAQGVKSGPVVVATADSAERAMVESLGAEVLSPDQLQAWVERVGRAQSDAVRRHSRTVDTHWRVGGRRGPAAEG
jgi:predicted RNA-binding protein with PIN domain